MQKRATEVEKERGENGLVMSNQEVMKNMFIPETLEPNSQVITKKHTADTTTRHEHRRGQMYAFIHNSSVCTKINQQYENDSEL